MPLTAKGTEILNSLVKQYGPEKGERVLYAGKNKGTFTGIDSAGLSDFLSAADAFLARADAFCTKMESKSDAGGFKIPMPKDPKERAEYEAAIAARKARGGGKFVGDE